ncbi:MAG: type 2 isopentenyl-diphosphate Delta-isomerase [Bdellovibrionales bacterium CG10_big_fil_rev_8_21_14_0_10_45_34]|nr:MAG: type 2 isopentenyl-diphosphate Delta-isomerase [Bdellovibrionales bacterium CG10_big_fil_rev_8_21_14_0_10_45_34]
MNDISKKPLLNQASESISDFESRKRDHIELALGPDSASSIPTGLQRVRLVHRGLPEINFEDVTLCTRSILGALPTPFLISSMTAGHPGADSINNDLFFAAESKGWLIGIGSQRRQLFDLEANEQMRKLRRRYPRVKALCNLGLSQLVNTNQGQIEQLVDSLEPAGFIVHLNPLQEALQTEGTPFFRGGQKRLEKLVESLNIPVVAKETGSGLSLEDFQVLLDSGVQVADVAGLGGTHWGRIESVRRRDDFGSRSLEAFGDWGNTTLQSLLWSVPYQKKGLEVWASGGIKTGVDAAKTLALGARIVGFAQAPLKALTEQKVDGLLKWMDTIEAELKISLFCTGSEEPSKLNNEIKYQIIGAGI